jgi:hypothetical protein
MRGLSVLAGVLLGAFSLAGLWVDVGNNWAYGITVSHEAAIVLAAAAIGVAAFPAVAALRGWSWLLGAATGVCLILTIGAAFLAYTAKQGAAADTRRGSAETYRSAKQDEAAARAEETAAQAEAAAIDELAGVEELDLLAGRAQQAADEAATIATGQGVLCVQVKRCRQAEEALAAMTQRLGQAKAKAAALERADEARRRIKEAQSRAKSGPASAPLSAMWIAARGGWQAEEVDASMNVGLTVLMIVFTQLLAWCAHPAVKCFAWALHPLAAPMASEPPAVTPVHQVGSRPVMEQPKAAPRSRKRSVVERVQAWARDALVSRAGAAVPAGDVFAAFQADAGPDITQAAFGAAMANVGFSKTKRGGKVVYLGVIFRQALRLAAGS